MDDYFALCQLGNDERDRQKGLGLGLAIARGLAVSMDARITLNSRLGRGSIFSLWLPRAHAARPTPTKIIVNSTPRDGALLLEHIDSRKALASLGGLQVLVVDDVEAVRLREPAGYRATLLHKPVSAQTLRDALVASAVLG